MQGSNETLRKALKESLEKDLSFVPDDKEIKEVYTPSPKLEKQMQKLISHVQRKEKFQIIVRNKKKLSYVAVAAVVIFGIRLGMPLTQVHEKADDKSVRLESVPAESSEQYEEESIKDSAKSDSTQQSTPTYGIEEDTGWSVIATSEDNVVLLLLNNSANDWYYTGITRIEKMDQGNVSVVYTNNNLEEKILMPTANIDETLNRSDYNMNESGRYILYRTVNENQITIELEIP